jgi:hypothetical protein
MTALWTLEDIAAYYNRSVRHARRIVTEEGFPPPARGDRHRWVPAQVIAWSEQPAAPAPPVPVPAGARVVRRAAA